LLLFRGKQAQPAERSEGSLTTADKILRCAQDDIDALRMKYIPAVTYEMFKKGVDGNRSSCLFQTVSVTLLQLENGL